MSTIHFAKLKHVGDLTPIYLYKSHTQKNSAAMDSRTMLFLLWMLLSFTCTVIKLDGNGYVDLVIEISSKEPQDDTLIDKIKMIMFFQFYIYMFLSI